MLQLCIFIESSHQHSTNQRRQREPECGDEVPRWDGATGACPPTTRPAASDSLLNGNWLGGLNPHCQMPTDCPEAKDTNTYRVVLSEEKLARFS
jgi:hypothetical protein